MFFLSGYRELEGSGTGKKRRRHESSMWRARAPQMHAAPSRAAGRCPGGRHTREPSSRRRWRPPHAATLRARGCSTAHTVDSGGGTWSGSRRGGGYSCDTGGGRSAIASRPASPSSRGSWPRRGQLDNSRCCASPPVLGSFCWSSFSWFIVGNMA